MTSTIKTYTCPSIEKIELDNAISLTLDSAAMTPWDDPVMSLEPTELLMGPEMILP